MARAFVSRPVADYEKWRPIFDADRPRLSAAGVAVVAVLHDTDNPNSVWICLDGDRAVGEQFLQDPKSERSCRMQECWPPPGGLLGGLIWGLPAPRRFRKSAL
jgi:hypothetical protein